MLEQRYHATTHNWFHPDMSTVNKNIAAEAKLISPPTYLHHQQGELTCPFTLRLLPFILMLTYLGVS